MCESLIRWREEGRQFVLIREIRGGRGCFLHRSSREADQTPCLVSMRLQEVPLSDIRLTISDVLFGAEEVWMLNDVDPGHRQCQQLAP